MSRNGKVDFEHGSVYGNVLALALPMLAAQLLHLLYSIVDRMYIGRIPGTGSEALGAVGLAFPVIILITAFTNMFGLGGAPLFSMALGRKEPDTAEAILHTVYKLEVLTGVVFMVLGEIFAPHILTLFGADGAQLSYGLPYLRIYLLGTVSSMIAAGLNPFINAQGFSLVGMSTILVGAAANILLDPLFIFVFGLGASGAAIATVISQVLSMAFVLRFFAGKNTAFHLEFGNLFSLPHAADIVSLGTAPFIMQVTNSLVSIVCNRMLLANGGAVLVSVMTIITSVRQILDTPVAAVTEGAGPVISYNYGAGRRDRMRRCILFMTVLAVSYTAVIWFLVEVAPHLFIGIFTGDQELRELAVRPLHLYFFAFVFQALQYTGQAVFKSLGMKKQAIFFSLFRKVVLVVPLTILLPSLFSLGSDGVFIAEPISNFIGGSACFLTMLFTVVRSRSGKEQEGGKETQ